MNKVKEKITILPGKYQWSSSEGIPGLDLLEVGGMECEGIRYFDGVGLRYLVDLPDGKKIYVSAFKTKEGNN